MFWKTLDFVAVDDISHPFSPKIQYKQFALISVIINLQILNSTLEDVYVQQNNGPNNRNSIELISQSARNITLTTRVE